MLHECLIVGDEIQYMCHPLGKTRSVTLYANKLYLRLHLATLRAGVCRPCDTIELTATSCNFSLCRRVEKVCADRQLFRYS